MRNAVQREIEAWSGSFRLAGTLSSPVGPSIATLLMHPGSGPSNRAGLILDHDPVPAMRSITVPLLAVFGADDEVVPVDKSVTAFRANVPSQLPSIAVLAGGDHRVQVGDPKHLADGYAGALVEFINDQTH